VSRAKCPHCEGLITRKMRVEERWALYRQRTHQWGILPGFNATCLRNYGSLKRYCKFYLCYTLGLFSLSFLLRVTFSPVKFIFWTSIKLNMSRDSSVDIAMGYVLDGPGSSPGTVRFFSSPQHPVRFWGTPSVLSDMYQGRFSRG
jgi:hypothetical protein